MTSMKCPKCEGRLEAKENDVFAFLISSAKPELWKNSYPALP